MAQWAYKLTCMVLMVGVCCACYVGGYVQGWHEGYGLKQADIDAIYYGQHPQKSIFRGAPNVLD